MRTILPTLLLLFGLACIFSAITYVVDRLNKKSIENVCYHLSVIMFIAYIAALLYVTIFSRSPSDQQKIYLIPLGDIISIIQEKRFHDLEGVALNVVMLIPFGFLGRHIIRKHHYLVIVGLGVALSLMVETVQYITFLGSFDINDVIYNSIGTAIGLCISEFIRKRKLNGRGNDSVAYS